MSMGLIRHLVFLVFLVPTTNTAAASGLIHVAPLLLLASAPSSTAYHPIYAVRVVQVSIAASQHIVVVFALTLPIPGGSSPLAIGGLLALFPAVASINTTGQLPSFPILLDLAPGSSTTARAVSVFLVSLDPAAPAVPSATSGLTSTFISVVPMLIVTAVISAMAMEQILVVYAVGHDGRSDELATLVFSLQAVQGVLAQFMTRLSQGRVNPHDDEMQIDDPDHPMADETANYTEDDTEDTMDIDEDV